MPRINRIAARESVQTPGILGSASPLEFSSPLAISELDRGITQIGQATLQVAGVLAVKEKRRAESRDRSWVSSQQASIKDQVTDFQKDPNNYSAEDYAERTKNFITGKLQHSLKDSPSKKASDRLTQLIESYSSSKYSDASVVEERNRLDNVKEGIIEDISVALGTYRNGLSVPNGTPLKDLSENAELIRHHIDESFGEVAPKLAKRLHAYVDAEQALGIAKEYPDAAKNIIETSSALSEEEKITLKNKIKSMADAFDIRKTIAFEHQLNDIRSQAAAGATWEKVPEDSYLANYSSESQALAKKASDDFFIDSWNQAHDHFKQIQNKRADAATSYLSELDANLIKGSSLDRAVLDNVNELMAGKLKQQYDDAPGWLYSNNHEIVEHKSAVQTAANETDRVAALTALHDRVLELQGYPHQEDDPDMGPIQYPQDVLDQYLHRATGEYKLLPQPLAKQSADFLNSALPSEFGRRMHEYMQSFPKPEHQQIVYNDLVREGLRQSYQMVWQNRDEWWVGSLVTALSSTKGLENISDETKTKYKEQVRAHPTWISFEQSLIGPNQDRISDISGFLDATATFAMFHDRQPGTTMESAVDRAITLGISSSMAFSSVNGVPVVFNAKKSDGTQYTKEETEDIGRRLGVSLRWLDVRKVNQDPFLFLQQISPDKTNINRYQKLRDHITQTGHWVTENDGETMSLYVKDDMGFSLQLRDELNKPFAINLNDLPQFTYNRAQEGLWDEDQLVFDLPTTFKDKPKKRYPLITTENHTYLIGPGTSFLEWAQKDRLVDMIMDPPKVLTLFPTYSKSVTNFPTQPPWMQNPQEPGPVPSLNLKLNTKP